MTEPPPSLRGSGLQRAVQRALIALWEGIIPALLAGLVLRDLVPPAGHGVEGVVAAWGHRFELYFGVGLFLVFSAMARYWRYRLPGGRYASVLPAHLAVGERDAGRLAQWASDAALYEQLRSGRTHHRVERTVDAEKLAEFDRRVADLRVALEAGDGARAREAARAARSIASAALATQRRWDGLSLIATSIAVVGGVLAVRARWVESYEVFGESMLPTFEPGDRIAGDKWDYAFASGHVPHRGDIIAFRSSGLSLGPRAGGFPDVLVKRVIGLPGDRIEMQGDVPVINGWPVPSCDAGEYLYVYPDASGRTLHGRLRVEFLDERAYLTVRAPATPFPDGYRVKPGEVFVLGDNRGNSIDSRAFGAGRGAGVPIASIQARAARFLLGTHRNGETDFERFLGPVDGLQVRLRLEGPETDTLESKVEHCLNHQPKDTRPPPPEEPSAARERD